MAAAAWNVALPGATLVEAVGQGAFLVRPHSSAASLTAKAQIREAAVYDPRRDACPSLLKSGAFSSCSPNYRIKAAAVPNDQRWSDLWGLQAERGIDAPAAWDKSQGSYDTVVAVIDTGADYTHPDLQGNLWTNTAETPGNGRDDDGNGYVDDYYGASMLGPGNATDENGHGTHVAGTIGASGNNGIGVAGINWRVRIMPVKFLDAGGSGSLAGAIKAIDYVTAMRARGVNVRLSNNSWGGGSYSQALHNAIKRAGEAGVIFVAAAGNESNDNDAAPSYPGSYALDNVVSVAALTRNQNLADFSNYGASTVDIAAPGVSILSTAPGGGYQSMSGTSMAAPHVAGALALLISAEPALSDQQLIARLYESGTELASLSGVVRTSRKLNLGRLLRGDAIPVPTPTPAPPPCHYTVESIGYNPDYRADNAPIVVQADELGFQQVALPFEFPFHRELISSLIISPNGVLYTRQAPATMDYENGSTAPLNSIAPLHTDLSASADPYGVRVAKGATWLTVYWRSKVFGYEDLADVEVRATLYSDGRIESFLSAPNPQLEQALQSGATIGLAGPGANSAATFAANSQAIQHGLGVRFSRDCSQSTDPFRITAFEILGETRTGQETAKAVPGRGLSLRVLGSGSGSVDLSVGFNGKWCPSFVPVVVSDGSASLHTNMPKVGARYGKVNFRLSSGHTKALKIQRKYRAKGISLRRFEKHCQTLLTGLR